MKISRQQTLLLLPMVVFIGLCLVFRSMEGGTGVTPKKDSIAGLNLELPAAKSEMGKVIINKRKAYELAEQDSMRRRQLQMVNVFRFADTSGRASGSGMRFDSGMGFNSGTVSISGSAKADQLLQQLNRLQQSIRQPAALTEREYHRPVWHEPQPTVHPEDTTTEHDPQIDRLNAMLDKVIRIQHPAEAKAAAALAAEKQAPANIVLPLDSSGNTLPAVVMESQTVSTGMTIGLRLMEAAIVDGQVIPAGQLVYGVVAINNDRLQIHINAIRYGNRLFPTDLQVYDLDGLEGIHIPGLLSRDVAKQSADQGMGALTLNSYDASIGTEAANAGITTAKSLFSRKVRLVRAGVRAGYQVLLRNTKFSGSMTRSISGFKKEVCPPGFVPGGSPLARCRQDGLDLGLQGIYLKDSLLWMQLRWRNYGPIYYHPAYVRWFIRDRKHFKRTAIQEWTLEPVYADSVWTGFHPFSLTKDKELVVEAGEAQGARTLVLTIGEKQFKTIKQLK